MNNNKKPITLLDILKNAKTRGAKTLKEAMNITIELSNRVVYGAQTTPIEKYDYLKNTQMTPFEEYDYLMKHGRTYEGNPITEDSDIDYAIELLQSPDYTIYRDMYCQALRHENMAEKFGNES